MNSSRSSLLRIAACTALLAAVPSAWAQGAASWPTRPVKLIVGFPGGSTPDMAARTLAEPLARALGQPVIVENKPGASGNIAADQVAKATDDHTLGVVITATSPRPSCSIPSCPTIRRPTSPRCRC